MSFWAAFEGAHDAMRDPAIFGVAVTVRRADGSAVFNTQGIRDDEESSPDPEGVPYSGTVHFLGLQKSRIPWDPVHQDSVIIDSKEWIVTNVVDEGQGILVLQLHQRN